MIKEEREAYNAWLAEQHMDELERHAEQDSEAIQGLLKELDEHQQRITDLEQQLAASEAGAGVMRKALLLAPRLRDVSIDQGYYSPEGEKYEPACIESAELMAMMLETAESTDVGKAAAEKLAKLEAFVEAVDPWIDYDHAENREAYLNAKKALDES